MGKTKLKDELSKTEMSKKSPFYIVGIGASAGGLEALEHFFDSCPHDTGIAFVVIQHLSPDYKSLMTELLSRHTKMKVNEAKNNEIVKPNNVYLIPRNKNLTVEKGKLKLTKRPAKTQINFSIDIFFHSLAKEQKEMAIGVILSGTGSDGTRGGKSIKEVGGTVFVQNPESGRFDGMTRSAIHHGLADYVLPPEEMPAELILFVSHPHFTKTMMTGSELGRDIEAMDRVLRIVKTHTGYDFFSYKKPTLLRRTAKRMNITKNETIEDYIDYLYQNTAEKSILVDEFLIGVTKFFRNTEAYDILQKHVIPNIIEPKKAKKSPIKIWTVACSTGEEAYSLAILMEEYLESKKINLKYKIFATDIDSKALDVATKGIYASNISLDISASRLSKYFIKTEDKFQIQPFIRKNIIFSKHDILEHPPFNKMDLVSCRNMLIYIDNAMQAKILSSLHYSLNMNGYLFMGSSESIGLLNKNFTEVSNKWKIYRNLVPNKILNVSGTQNWQIGRAASHVGGRSRILNTYEEKINKLINDTLTKEYESVSVCINKNYEIIHATGKFKKYINMPDQGFSNNLIKILPDQISLPITSAIRSLVKNNSDVVTKHVKLLIDEKIMLVKVIVELISITRTEPSNFLITILEKIEKPVSVDEKEKHLLSTDISTNPLLLEEVDELKEELNETRENLQATIEELETSNEEMQATNEELLASNEELQSTNEELQSLNEELHTVNAELQEKNVQLLEANSDIENLMTNTNIGTIFLDKTLAIRKFTPAIKEHFHIREEDIGRQIEHFSSSVKHYDLVNESKKVISDLKPFKGEFQNEKGEWFMLQVFPYRTQNDVIKGVVVNFININELKQAYNEKDKLNQYILHLANSAPVSLYEYDIKRNVNVFSTGSLADIAGYNSDDLEKFGSNLLETIVHPNDLDIVQSNISKLKKMKDGELTYQEYRVVHKQTKEPIWVSSTDKVHKRDKKGKVLTVLGVLQNINQSKGMELQLELSEERARLALEGTGAALWEWSDIGEDDAYWSPQFYDLLGYSAKKVEPSFAIMLHYIHPDCVEDFQDALNEHFINRAPFEIDLRMQTKKEGYKWFRINVQARWDKKGNAEKVVGTLLDIDQQTKNEQLIKDEQEKLEAIYQNAPVGIVLSTMDAVIMQASLGLSKMLGYSEKELIGKHINHITYHEDHSKSIKHIKNLTDGLDNNTIVDKRYVAKDKSIVWAQVRTRAVKDSSGESYIVAILNDINDNKKAEIKMRRLNKELERFAYLASHDLKEPLRTISSLTERLVSKHGEKLGDKGMQYVDMISTASHQMETLTEDLLTYSQLGHSVDKYEKINLNALLKKIKTDLKSSITENKAKLEFTRLPSIFGDSTQIRLLLQNLISNSIKYRKKASPIIKISCVAKGNFWELAVKDNGIGIDKESHTKIFEVFKRLHSRSEYAGTGIGLSNCKRIVENHKGEIWVKSSPRRGATFFFTIPKQKK